MDNQVHFYERFRLANKKGSCSKKRHYNQCLELSGRIIRLPPPPPLPLPPNLVVHVKQLHASNFFLQLQYSYIHLLL